MGTTASPVGIMGSRRTSRWPKLLVFSAVLVLLAIYLAPRLIVDSLGDTIVLTQLPGGADRWQVASVVLGWRTPLELRGVRYSSEAVDIEIESVRCERTLINLLWDRHNLGKVELISPRVTVRLEDPVPEIGWERDPGAPSTPAPPALSPWGSFAESLAVDLRVTSGSLTFVGPRADVDFDVDPIELIGHWANREARFEPIETSFRGGVIRLRPSVNCRRYPPVLTARAGPALDHIEIDPGMLVKLLRYVDPLSTISRNLRGQVSFDVEQLEIPLAWDGLERGNVVGQLHLHDVEFAPDGWLRDVLAEAGVDPDLTLRASQSISIEMRDGRVYQRGLTLPFGDDVVTLDGWVGLDHSMEICLGMPVTEQMVGRDRRVYRLIRGQRIELLVTGTLDQPRVSQEAVARNIQRLVQTTLRDSLTTTTISLRGWLRRPTR